MSLSRKYYNYLSWELETHENSFVFLIVAFNSFYILYNLNPSYAETTERHLERSLHAPLTSYTWSNSILLLTIISYFTSNFLQGHK